MKLEVVGKVSNIYKRIAELDNLREERVKVLKN
ncbi:hypothetical protein M948_14510 [Virgibacillus sp. CM-4]|nr:hypothetical protein M948_14510 [Virgibacillus sp. CM-4]